MLSLSINCVVISYVISQLLSYLVEVVVHAVLPVGHRNGRIDRLQRLLYLQRQRHVVVDQARTVVPVVAIGGARTGQVLPQEILGGLELGAVFLRARGSVYRVYLVQGVEEGLLWKDGIAII